MQPVPLVPLVQQDHKAQLVQLVLLDHKVLEARKVVWVLLLLVHPVRKVLLDHPVGRVQLVHKAHKAQLDHLELPAHKVLLAQAVLQAVPAHRDLRDQLVLLVLQAQPGLRGLEGLKDRKVLLARVVALDLLDLPARPGQLVLQVHQALRVHLALLDRKDLPVQLVLQVLPDHLHHIQHVLLMKDLRLML